MIELQIHDYFYFLAIEHSSLKSMYNEEWPGKEGYSQRLTLA